MINGKTRSKHYVDPREAGVAFVTSLAFMATVEAAQQRVGGTTLSSAANTLAETAKSPNENSAGPPKLVLEDFCRSSVEGSVQWKASVATQDAAFQQYYQDNTEAILEKGRQWREAHPEYDKQWRDKADDRAVRWAWENCFMVEPC